MWVVSLMSGGVSAVKQKRSIWLHGENQNESRSKEKSYLIVKVISVSGMN